jgi:hypothetical protein
MALYLKKLAVLDVANSTVAQLVNVMEGAEGSAVFGYNQTDSALVVANGQKTQFKQTHTVSLSVLPPSGADATVMDGILNAVEPLSVKVAGMSDDTFLLWDDAVALTQKDEYGDTLTRNLNMTLDATIGYRGTAPNKKKAVYSGGNLLALFDVLTGSSTALNGFTVLNNATGSVTGAEQTITAGATTAGGTVYLRSANLLFPFAGEVISASADFLSADNDFAIGIEFVQANGTTIISTSSNAVSVGDIPGRFAVQATVPANTVYVRFIIASSLLNTSDSVIIQAPAIRLGGIFTYTN